MPSRVCVGKSARRCMGARCLAIRRQCEPINVQKGLHHFDGKKILTSYLAALVNWLYSSRVFATKWERNATIHNWWNGKKRKKKKQKERFASFSIGTLIRCPSPFPLSFFFSLISKQIYYHELTTKKSVTKLFSNLMKNEKKKNCTINWKKEIHRR